MPATVAREIVERTRLFLAKDEQVVISALDACRDCIDADPGGPFGDAGQITAAVASVYYGWLKRAGEWSSPDKANCDHKLWSAKFVTQRATPILANGLVTEARSRSGDHYAEMQRLLVVLSDSEARVIQRIFDEAQIETDALLVDGKTGAQVARKTKEEVYGEVQTFYEMYVAGDLVGALRGFTHLRRINPLDSYIRNMRGAVLSAQGKSRDAMRDFLFGFRLAPGNTDIAANLVRECTVANFSATAVAASRHYAAHRSSDVPPESERQLKMLANFSAIALQTVACSACRVGPEEFDANAANALDGLPAQERFWRAVAMDNAVGDEVALQDARLFISYRRAEGADHVQRLHRALKAAHPSLQIFLDEGALIGGEHFVERIREEIGSASAFVLVIGPRWSSKKEIARLHDTKDVVRREVAWALLKGVPIVPVLLNETAMPDVASLPEVLRPISHTHAICIRSDSFEADCAKLQGSLSRIITDRLLRSRATEQELEEIHALPNEKDANKRFGELVKDWKETLPLSMKVKAPPDAGIKAKVELLGVWECMVTDATELTSFRLLLEPRKRLTGEWRRHATDGSIVGRYELRGEWARVENEAGGGLLGIYLKYVLEGRKKLSVTIPFHDRASDALIGVDESGRQYISRNMEARVGGF